MKLLLQKVTFELSRWEGRTHILPRVETYFVSARSSTRNDDVKEQVSYKAGAAYNSQVPT